MKSMIKPDELTGEKAKRIADENCCTAPVKQRAVTDGKEQAQLRRLFKTKWAPKILARAEGGYYKATLVVYETSGVIPGQASKFLRNKGFWARVGKTTLPTSREESGPTFTDIHVCWDKPRPSN